MSTIISTGNSKYYSLLPTSAHLAGTIFHNTKVIERAVVFGCGHQQWQ